MSYQVLARKWRPRSFETLVGQEHVVRALTHALQTGRLHHAYLFTGTRGVGKTTISRILAKSLNCETGVGATPCGQCAACTAIDADRFPDYVEMDAASNRGVDDMASLLDKAVYAPVQGRYKVYMIDEVHMLTGHAFNAMLKTLEEPPEHVKFILATTDPQKIPVTVLSRCLQFNLKQMPPLHVVEHLQRILEAEQVPFEPGALRHLAKAANGSMRDALSLLDQAIAHGAGQVQEQQVVDMLGTVGDDHLYALLDALQAGEVAVTIEVADRMAARSLSFEAALQELASLLQRIAVLQFAPDAESDEFERERLGRYAQALDREYLQLAYQIAIHGRNDLPLAPDEYAGFTMTLLRLHAFRPEQPAGLDQLPPAPAPAGQARALPSAAPAAAGGSAAATAKPAVAPQAARGGENPPPPIAARESGHEAVPPDGDSLPPWEDLPEQFHAEPAAAKAPTDERSVPPAAQRAGPAEAPPPAEARAKPAESAAVGAAGELPDWHGLIRAMGLGGMVRELAQHCELAAVEGDEFKLRLGSTHRHLLSVNRAAGDKIRSELGRHLGREMRLSIEVGEIAGETPAQRDQQVRAEQHAAAVASLERDPFVRELIERFDATLLESSVRPLRTLQVESNP